MFLLLHCFSRYYCCCRSRCLGYWHFLSFLSSMFLSFLSSWSLELVGSVVWVTGNFCRFRSWFLVLVTIIFFRFCRRYFCRFCCPGYCNLSAPLSWLLAFFVVYAVVCCCRGGLCNFLRSPYTLRHTYLNFYKVFRNNLFVHNGASCGFHKNNKLRRRRLY